MDRKLEKQKRFKQNGSEKTRVYRANNEEREHVEFDTHRMHEVQWKMTWNWLVYVIGLTVNRRYNKKTYICQRYRGQKIVEIIKGDTI